MLAAIRQARTTTNRAAAFHSKTYGARRALGSVAAARLAALAMPAVAVADVLLCAFVLWVEPKEDTDKVVVEGLGLVLFLSACSVTASGTCTYASG